MRLESGTHLGPYEILAPLGAGGMGEVYRARDTRLGRDVAVKVLPERLSSSPDFRQRFEREARAISSLQHPHICVLHDIGREEAVGEFLVMELLEGETVAERLKLGKVPLQELLKVGMEMADALDKAHRKGVVHRDLKPGNIMLTKSGSKLMDFGLAKPAALGAAGGAGTAPLLSAAVTADRASPASPITSAGVIVGTIHYMSPEQIEGKEADARSDIFAFGATLYEMATGVHAFPGKSQLSVASAILEKDPEPISKAQPLVPAALDRVVAHCLAKNADDRFQSAHDVGLELKWISAEADSSHDVAAGLPGQDETGGVKPPLQRALPWAGMIAFATIAVLLAIRYIARAPEPAKAVVSEISSPANASFAFGGNLAGPPVVSPDGQRLAFAATGSDRKQRLWVRPLNAATAQSLEGTDGATFPFWSPDGRSLGFFANGKLNHIDASGGPSLAIAAASDGRGGSWCPDGTILFTPDTVSPIYRVSASGGTPQPLTKLNASRQEVTHRWPQFLPDGKHFLFYAHGNNLQNNATYAASLEGGEPTLLVRGDSNVVYAPPGYLLFVREGTLMAQRFDAGSLSSIGEAMPLAEHAAVDSVVWRGVFAVSENGLLAYQAGNVGGENGQLLWFDRSGKQIGETGPLDYFTAASLSPDGRKLAAQNGAPGGSGFNIWVFDLARGIGTRLTFSPGINAAPSWSPDGKTIVFASDRSGQFHLYQKAADGTGSTLPLVRDNAQENNPSFSSDGRYAIFERLAATPGSRNEIWALPLFGDRKAFPVIQSSQFNVSGPALSPDGKWLAYASHESGVNQIYVVPFGHGSGKWEVSITGGTIPRWRHDGRELFYLSLDNKIMSAEISEQGVSLAIGKVAPLFQTNPVFSSHVHWTYDVSADGKKFVVATQGAPPKTTEPLTLVVNWPGLLEKR